MHVFIDESGSFSGFHAGSISVVGVLAIPDQLRAISEEVGDERSLLVCCKAFRAKVEAFPNLSVRKIPQAVLKKCEWGKDDYSLNVANLPSAIIADDDLPADIVFEELKRIGQCSSRSQFSREWLGREESYYRSITVKRRRPSAEAQLNLVSRLRDLAVTRICLHSVQVTFRLLGFLCFSALAPLLVRRRSLAIAIEDEPRHRKVRRDLRDATGKWPRTCL
jgi:hypothetical protein